MLEYSIDCKGQSAGNPKFVKIIKFLFFLLKWLKFYSEKFLRGVLRDYTWYIYIII